LLLTYHPHSLAYRTDFKQLLFGFRWADNRLTVDDFGSILFDTFRLESDPVFIGHYFNNLGTRGDGITDTHRGQEIEFLTKINGSGAWKHITQNIRYQSGGQHAMGDAGFEKGPLSIGLINVGRIKIAGYANRAVSPTLSSSIVLPVISALLL
jgi:hypothetical protein